MSIAGSDEVDELPTASNRRGNHRDATRQATRGRGGSRDAVPPPTAGRGRGSFVGSESGVGGGRGRGRGRGGRGRGTSIGNASADSSVSQMRQNDGPSGSNLRPPSEPEPEVPTRRGTRRLQSTTDDSDAPPSRRARR